MDNQDNPAKARLLLKKYLAGDCTPEEEKQVLAWYYSFNQQDDLSVDKDKEQVILSSVKSSLLKAVATKKSIYRQLLHAPWIKAAAILLIFFSVTLATVKRLTRSKSPAVTYSELTTKNGERKAITLPDGSLLTLNAASKIRIPSDFGIKNRTVELTGEAFFEVVHNADNPFLVKAGKLITKDIGTSFNIKAYADEPAIQVAVLTGKVGMDLQTSAGSKQLAPEIQPNQLLSYDKISNKHILKKANAAHIAAWTHNELYFDAVAIPDIAQVLERRYNVRIKITGTPGTCLYTVKFSNEPINKVMDILANLSGANWEINQHQITINTKNCK